LRGRAALKRALVLIDSRHGIKDVDTDMLDMLDGAAVSYRIVLTKTDKIKASDLAKVTQATADAIRKRPAAHPDIIATSSEKGMGLPELRAAVLESVTQG
jgi:GTP-binding protein